MKWLSNIILNSSKHDDIDISFTFCHDSETISSRCRNNEHDNENEHDKSSSSDRRLGRQIKILIKQSIQNIVRVVYSGKLIIIPSSSSSSSSSQSVPQQQQQNNNVMSFLHSLSTTINESQSTIQSIKQQNIKLQQELIAWKDTAMELEQTWQSDKDETMENFLVLLNRVKADYRKVVHELKLVKDNKEEEGGSSYRVQDSSSHQQKQQKQQSSSLSSSLSSTMLRSKSSGSGGKRKNKDTVSSAVEVAPMKSNLKGGNTPVIHNHNTSLFDEHEAALLARGKRVYDNIDHSFSSTPLTLSQNKKKAKVDENIEKTNNGTITNATTNLQRQSTVSSHQSAITTITNSTADIESSSQRQSQESAMTIRSNPLTGVIEMWNTDELFKDNNNNSQISSVSLKKNKIDSENITIVRDE